MADPLETNNPVPIAPPMAIIVKCLAWSFLCNPFSFFTAESLKVLNSFSDLPIQVSP
jgi:hypothetical protein